MQINNFQRIVENVINADRAELERKLSEIVRGSMTPDAIADSIIMLARLASIGGVELEQTLLKRIDDAKKQ